MNFYNSNSFIFQSKYFKNIILAGSQARLTYINNNLLHCTNGDGFFFPTKNLTDIIKELKKINVTTCYLTLHPLFFWRDILKKTLKTQKKIFYINLKKENNFNNYSKSLKIKIKKNIKLALKKSTELEFIDLYKKQIFFDSNKKLNLNFKNLKIFKVENESGKSISVFGFGKNTIEYLLSCSSIAYKDLQGVLLYKIIEMFKNNYDYLNLGGGIKSNDGLENFKSYFKSDFIKSSVLKLIIDKKKYDKNVKTTKNTMFPGYLND
jgi:hypothetical protein